MAKIQRRSGGAVHYDCIGIFEVECGTEFAEVAEVMEKVMAGRAAVEVSFW